MFENDQQLYNFSCVKSYERLCISTGLSEHIVENPPVILSEILMEKHGNSLLLHCLGCEETDISKRFNIIITVSMEEQQVSDYMCGCLVPGCIHILAVMRKAFLTVTRDNAKQYEYGLDQSGKPKKFYSAVGVESNSNAYEDDDNWEIVENNYENYEDDYCKDELKDGEDEEENDDNDEEDDENEEEDDENEEKENYDNEEEDDENEEEDDENDDNEEDDEDEEEDDEDEDDEMDEDEEENNKKDEDEQDKVKDAKEDPPLSGRFLVNITIYEIPEEPLHSQCKRRRL